MANFENVKQQKLIIEYRGGATLYFIDENQAQHEHDYSGGEIVDFYTLAMSCFEPVGDDSILTCSCGWPVCAEFESFKWKITDTEILWDINRSEDLFRFDKNQYIKEVKTTIEKLMKLCGNGTLEDGDEEEYFRNLLTKETLEMYYSPFIDSTLTLARSLPRHKIIIQPGDKYIYITDTGKKVFIKNKDLSFYDTDVFKQPLIYSFNATDIKKWYEQMNNKNTDWEKWNEKGLKIAKYLRGKLPLAFDIWYQYQNVEDNKLVQIQLQV